MTTSILPLRRSLTARARSRSTERVAALLVAVIVAPHAAFAGKKTDAKVHIAKATKAHQDGRFNEARAELEAAYALDPQPDLLYAIGQVHAKLGNCSDAITYYKLFVAVQKDPDVAQAVDHAISACKPAPDPAKPSPPDTLPPPNAPLAGRQVLPPREDPRGTAPAHKPPRSAGWARPATPRSQPLARSKPAPAPVLVTRRAPWYQDKLGDGLMLGGIAATVVGLVEYRGALSALDAAEDRASTTSLTRYHELIEDADTKRTTSIVLTGAGGTLIAAGVLRYVLHDRTEEVRAVAVDVALVSGGGVVTYRGKF